MDYWWIIGIAVVALIIGPMIGGAVHIASFNGKFQHLGDIAGKPAQTIIDQVGPPTSITAVPDGSLYQWVKQVGFNNAHCAIVFDADGNAVGYQHQSQV